MNLSYSSLRDQILCLKRNLPKGGLGYVRNNVSLGCLYQVWELPENKSSLECQNKFY